MRRERVFCRQVSRRGHDRAGDLAFARSEAPNLCLPTIADMPLKPRRADQDEKLPSLVCVDSAALKLETIETSLAEAPAAGAEPKELTAACLDYFLIFDDCSLVLPTLRLPTGKDCLPHIHQRPSCRKLCWNSVVWDYCIVRVQDPPSLSSRQRSTHSVPCMEATRPEPTQWAAVGFERFSLHRFSSGCRRIPLRIAIPLAYGDCPSLERWGVLSHSLVNHEAAFSPR